jgi:predicted phage tail protein
MPSFPYVMPQMLNLTPLAASGNSSAISLPPRSANMAVTVQVKFTKGSLTNGQVILQALHVDGATWLDVVTGAGALVGTAVLTADSSLAFSAILPGVKQVRCRYATTGTVTSSALVIDATVQQ